MFFSSMHPSWQSRLSASKDLLTEIEAQLISEPQITPPPALVMRAFQEPFESVKVLLIGQDPYPTKDVACGLAFAVSDASKETSKSKKPNERTGYRFTSSFKFRSTGSLE
jgi:uracil DNA glycosylase